MSSEQQNVKKVSFARPAAGTTAKAAEPIDVTATSVEATPAPSEPAPATFAVTAPKHQTPAVRNEPDDEVDVSDIRLPRLNLVQRTSGADLLNFGPGNFVYKQAVSLGKTIKVICLGFRPKRFSEKVKYGSPQGLTLDSLQDVRAHNGTHLWRESKEKPSIGPNGPAWFMPMVTGVFLIEKPEGVDDAYFGYEAGGKLYAPAVLTVKSTSYDAIYVTLFNEKGTGCLRQGYHTRFLEIKSLDKATKSGNIFAPALKVLEATPPEVLALVSQIPV